MAKQVAGQGGRIRARNQARILVAAEAVFAEAGFQGATTAAIAARAKLPKANLHYYFGTKRALYRAVLANILDLWLGTLDAIDRERHPAEALDDYIRGKMYWSRARPNASKVFANEILHGAPQLGSYLADDLRRRVAQKAAVFKHWASRGLMAPVDPVHLLFNLWAMTQHYADFDVQVRAVLGRKRMSNADFAAATDAIVRMTLIGCGVVASVPFPGGERRSKA
ncbi:TetR family transcriptional regulator C-terminal domain-containing protein [Reyranella sp. CPCC 100927]|uniref:TetR family transcriptional regulator C-terminal domain-containing protein n=1 Tax=Reyranella sp. CPCC 100927 TaxID=2599616 RepID=UPI0011B50046|nr:TetR family transcriptional regulator C-terminal domain-containing protein [Reyranella sp. CPCC 100927]TWS99458.1 TetR family transcriptional regulator [Reyranella sp. CPCC 100927]